MDEKQLVNERAVLTLTMCGVSMLLAGGTRLGGARIGNGYIEASRDSWSQAKLHLWLSELCEGLVAASPPLGRATPNGTTAIKSVCLLCARWDNLFHSSPPDFIDVARRCQEAARAQGLSSELGLAVFVGAIAEDAEDWSRVGFCQWRRSLITHLGGFPMDLYEEAANLVAASKSGAASAAEAAEAAELKGILERIMEKYKRMSE